MTLAGKIETGADLEQFLTGTWADLLAHIDFPLVRLCVASAEDDTRLFTLDDLASACRATAEGRKAQQQMGRQRLKLTAELSGHPRLFALHQAAEKDAWRANWPSVWGVEAACLNIAMPSALAAYGYQSVNGLLTASAKLIRIGPTEIQKTLYRCRPAIESAIETSLTVTEGEIGWFTPMLDIAGACHETAYTRLFMS